MSTRFLRECLAPLRLAVTLTLLAAAPAVAQTLTIINPVAGDVDSALRLAALGLEEPKDQGAALAGLVAAALTRDDLKAARAEIKGFRDDIWRARALLLIGDHQHKNGQTSSARESLQLAARGIKAGVPLRDNGEIFHTLVTRQAEIGDFAGAIATAKRIPDEVDRVRAMVEAANARLENSESSAVAAVEKSLKVAFGEAKSIEGRRSEVGLVLIEIGRAQAAVGDVAGARETFNFARIGLLATEFKERDETLAALAAAQVLSGDRIQAMNIVRAMEDEALRSMALASVAGALAESVDVDSARPLFRLAFEDAVKTVNEKARNEILQHILVEQTRFGLFNDAFTTAGSIRNREAQSRALLAMANVLLDRELFDQALKLVDFIPYISMRAQIFVTVALATGHAGDPLEASSLLARAVEPTGAAIFQKLLPPVLQRLIDAQVTVGAPQTTRALFSRIRELVDSLQSVPDRVHLLTQLAAGERQLLSEESARKTISAAWQLAWTKKDEPEFAIAMADVVEAQIMVGDLLEAFDTAVRIPTIYETGSDRDFVEPAYRALEAIALAAAKDGDGTFALRAVNQILNARARKRFSFGGDQPRHSRLAQIKTRTDC